MSNKTKFSDKLMPFIKKYVWSFIAGVALVMLLGILDASTSKRYVNFSEPFDTGYNINELRMSVINFLNDPKAVGVTDSIKFYKFKLEGRVDRIYPDNALVQDGNGKILSDSALKAKYPSIYEGIGFQPIMRIGRADDWYNWMLRNPKYFTVSIIEERAKAKRLADSLNKVKENSTVINSDTAE